ncbi:uncharacterized protein LOC114351417 [Ostrinia furnacalis]|uniref:uncharacterized protein LOC114351417 n=1 Tax=Ostrinia furnacalis TaxID=93504 RepID=UPI00103FDD9A|nr:uncharacterized protein LOC114351417 [Ostrinia furnacalis]
MESKNFFLVTFLDEDDAPGIVSSKWLIDTNTCYYPNVRTEEIKNKLLKKMAAPEATWSQYQIKILKSYETYGEARLHLKKAEETSNLDSDEEIKKRKRKINRVYVSDDSNSSNDCLPLKMTNARHINKKKEYSEYPTPPKSKAVGKNIVTENVTETQISAIDVITSPRSLPCSSDVEIYTYDEVELPTDKVNTTINCPTEEAPHCLPAEAENDVTNEVTVDIMPAVNYPVTSGSKEAKKTQLKAVNCQSECITNKQYAIQQSHMIQIVSDLANQMAEINRKLDLLLARSGETFSPTDDNPGLSELLASLPVKDIASFNNFDDHLKIKKDKQAIMSFLSGIGGRNVRSLTTNMLRRIILDDVAELYSLTGKQMKNSNKKSFMSTETYKLIFQICRKIYEDVTEDSLKEIISDWLNQAKVRLSRR